MGFTQFITCIFTADTRRRIIERDSSQDEDEEEDELNSSDSDSDSDHDTRTTKSKRKPAAANRRKATKTVPSAFLNNSSQLLIPVTQDPSTQDSLYGKCHLLATVSMYVKTDLVCPTIEKALIPEIDMEDVAEAWVKQYKTHQLAALRDLINLVIRVRSSFVCVCVWHSSASDALPPFL